MPIAGGESISVTPCAPARTTPRASSTTSGRGGRQLREDRDHRHARHRTDDLGGAVRVRAQDGALELLVGLREANLDGGDLRPALQHARQPDELLERAAGDRHDDRCAGTDVPRHSSSMNASMPRFWIPVVQVMPAGDSAIRGVGSPAGAGA
jgi:hypothetical protein